MKIAIVIYNLRWIGGGQRLILSSSQALKRLGHKVVIYVPDTEYADNVYPDIRKGLDIRLVKSPSPYIWRPPPAGLIRRMKYKWDKEKWLNEMAKRMVNAIDEDFDVFNCHDFAYKCAYFYRRKHPETRIVWTSNDPPYHYLPHKESIIYDIASRIFNYLKDYTETKYFRSIDEVAVLDRHNVNWCEKRGFKVNVVRLGVDIENFFIPVRDISKKSKEKKVDLVGLGILNPYRRYEDVVEAAKILKDQGYDVGITIVCRDFWKRDDLKNNLLGLVKKYDMESKVKFLFNGATDHELKKIFAESDIFVHPMYLPPPRDGFGFSIGLTEAIASGLPAITCKTTTNTEVLVDGKTALFVDPMSPDQIAEKIKLLMDSPKFYSAIASAGQNFVKENLTWDKYAESMVEIFSKK